MIETTQIVFYALWILMSILIFFGIIAQFYKTNKFDTKEKSLEFVIVSVANYGVKDSLIKSIYNILYKFSEYKLNVVIDEGAELEKVLRIVSRISNFNLIVVPNNYETNAIAKGKAINYFIENYVNDYTWYSFIDDDNLVMDDAFLYEIPYYDYLGYKATNPVLIPRRGDSSISYVADFIRTFDDLTIFRLTTGLLKKPYVGFHGELLTVKGDCLLDVKYEEKTIVEDFAFASNFIKKGYKCWQSRTRVSILSPNSIRDFIKQRSRWYEGIVKYLNNAPLFMKSLVGLKILLWTLSIFASWLFFPIWLMWDHTLLWLIIITILAKYYIIVYLIGVINTSGIFNKIKLFLLIPFYGILECAFKGVIKSR